MGNFWIVALWHSLSDMRCEIQPLSGHTRI